MSGRAKKSDFGVAVFYPQPVWFRILKYVLVFGMLYFLWGNKWVWMVLPATLVLGVVLHLWYRYKDWWRDRWL